MNPKEILETIARTGDCDDLNVKACRTCPLAKLKKRPDGQGWLGCMDAVCGSSTADMNDKYKKIAGEILADLLIQEEIADE